jgi:hypothetical protein
MSRFHLKTERNSSMRNVVLNKIKGRLISQNCASCVLKDENMDHISISDIFIYANLT